jgi:hypothetical protein
MLPEISILCLMPSPLISVSQATKYIQPSKPASAARVTGTPRRAKSRKEILTPNARACWTTMMLETLPRMMRLPPKLFASARI